MGISLAYFPRCLLAPKILNAKLRVMTLISSIIKVISTTVFYADGIVKPRILVNRSM
jgi:hypothetical protein